MTVAAARLNEAASGVLSMLAEPVSSGDLALSPGRVGTHLSGVKDHPS